jgi:hypothetical protein
MTAARRLAGELLGTAFLLAAVVGSGIMGEHLSGGNVAIALLANTLATGATLVTLIFTFGTLSGAHFNPAVTLADASQRGIRWRAGIHRGTDRGCAARCLGGSWFASFSVREKMSLRASTMRLANAHSALSDNLLANSVKGSI